MISSQYKKITQVIRYLIAKSPRDRINILKLMKLVWAADRYHVRKFANLITDYDYRALPRGPVSSIAYDIADASDFLSEEQIEYSKEYVVRSEHDIVGIKEAETDYLSETEREALDFAWNTFGKLDEFEVVDITHQYPEWKKFEAYFATGSSAKKIDLDDFFKNPDEDPYFEDSTEKLEASQSLFEENLDIRKLIKG